MQTIAWRWGVVALMLAGCLVGCVSVPPTTADRGYPPDFSLVFTVQRSEEVVDDDPLHRPSQHVLSPARTLRVALGSGAAHDYHPPITTRLSPERMVELYRLAEAGGLLEPNASSMPSMSADVYYHLTITAHGYRREYVTTPEARPAATLLLRRLVALWDE